jgi:hypothetical protein
VYIECNHPCCGAFWGLQPLSDCMYRFPYTAGHIKLTHQVKCLHGSYLHGTPQSINYLVGQRLAKSICLLPCLCGTYNAVQHSPGSRLLLASPLPPNLYQTPSLGDSLPHPPRTPFVLPALDMTSTRPVLLILPGGSQNPTHYGYLAHLLQSAG